MAKSSGLDKYFTGKPCPKNHICERYTTNSSCVECEKEASRIRSKKQYQGKISLPGYTGNKNLSRREALQKGETRYWCDKPCKHGHIGWRVTKTYCCVKCKKKPSANRRTILTTEESIKKREERHKKYISNLPIDVRKARNRGGKKKRRERLKAAGRRYTAAEIITLRKIQKNKCINCFTQLNDYHIDHIMPLSLGGDNSIKNIQLLCPPCNLSKHAKHPIDWAMENGRLV